MNYLKPRFTVTGDLAGVSAYRKNWGRVFGKHMCCGGKMHRDTTKTPPVYWCGACGRHRT